MAWIDDYPTEDPGDPRWLHAYPTERQKEDAIPRNERGITLSYPPYDPRFERAPPGIGYFKNPKGVTKPDWFGYDREGEFRHRRNGVPEFGDQRGLKDISGKFSDIPEHAWLAQYPTHGRFSQGPPGSGGHAVPRPDQQKLPSSWMEELRRIPGDVASGLKETATEAGRRYVEAAGQHPGPMAGPIYGVGNALLGVPSGPVGEAITDVGLSGYLPPGLRGIESIAGRRAVERELTREPVRSVERALPARQGAPVASRVPDAASIAGRQAVERELGPADRARAAGKAAVERALTVPDSQSQKIASEAGRSAVGRALAEPHAPITESIRGYDLTPEDAKHFRRYIEGRPGKERSFFQKIEAAQSEARIRDAFKKENIKPKDDMHVTTAARILREGRAADEWEAYEKADEEIYRETEHLKNIGVIPAGERDRLPPSGIFGLSADVSRDTVAREAAFTPGKVNRFSLRPLENIFDRVEGAHQAKRVEVTKFLRAFKDVPQEIKERTFRYGEGDPTVVLNPDEEAFFEQNVQPSRLRGRALYRQVEQLKKNLGLTDELELGDMDPGYMHRRTIDSASRLLGLDAADPITGYRHKFFSSVAPQTKPRKYFALDDGRGGRRTAYINQGRLYVVSKTYPQGVMVKQKVRLPGGERPKRGFRMNMDGREWRVTDAYTREIEGIGGPKYVKDSIAATQLSELELTRMRDMLLGVQEAQQYLISKNLASRTNNLPGTKGWVKTSAPGYGNLYMPERIARVIEARTPHIKNEDPFESLNSATHAMVGTMFWNPLFHPANVAAHVAFERGWRNFNPLSNFRWIKYFRQAMRDVSSQNANYQKVLREGGRLMLGTRVANREMTHSMFDGVKELQESAEGQGFLARLQKLAKIPPISFVKSYMRWAGDAMWQMGDVLTMTSFYERQAANPKEALRESIMRVHRDVPSYRFPTEEMLPGKAGRTISGMLQSSAVKSVFTFLPYHENVARGFAMTGEDILQSIIHAKNPAARKEGIEALGKIAAAAVAMGLIYPQADKAARAIAGDDQQARRFGLFSYLQLLLDFAEGKKLSKGAAVRLGTAGMYSPSPLLEIPFNLAGNQAYSLSPIYPENKYEKRPYSGSDVPWSRRLKTIAEAPFVPFGQLRGATEEPKATAFRALGATSFRRKTDAEKKRDDVIRKASPQYRSMHIKDKRRHEYSLPR